MYRDAETSLPKGWKCEEIKRINGKHVDRYWYTPHCNYRLRSKVQVKRFLDTYALEEFSVFDDGGIEKETAVWDKVNG